MRRPPNLMKTPLAPDPAPAPAEPGPPTNYLDLYGLSKPPFAEAAGKGEYILFGSHRRPFELLIEHVVNGSGVILLQGEEGIGKTETLRSIADVAADSGLQTILISRPPNDRINLAQFVAALEGQPAANETAAGDVLACFLQPPRKVLLVDDIDLMPQDCMKLLLSLAQHIPTEPGGPAIVLTSLIDPIFDANRPDLAQLLSLARNTVRLLRLGPAEIRQYIERSLWISGGTTRRLISSDAMKLLVARSGGVPRVTNRLMEAVLTAGFARGDSMITAKTVTAATGRTAPRPRRRINPPSGPAGRAMPIIAFGLLAVGASVFLYKGLNGQFDRHSPVPSKPVVQASPPTPPAIVTPQAQPQPEQPQPAKPAQPLPPELLAALMKHGDQAFSLGDIAAARLLYQRAAEAGNASAATALGKTYDPNYAMPGGNPDPARAADWYQRAIMLGDPHAADLLKRLGPH
jgi:type II secretory pathway predicted ATPase ExeA